MIVFLYFILHSLCLIYVMSKKSNLRSWIGLNWFIVVSDYLSLYAWEIVRGFGRRKLTYRSVTLFNNHSWLLLFCLQRPALPRATIWVWALEMGIAQYVTVNWYKRNVTLLMSLVVMCNRTRRTCEWTAKGHPPKNFYYFTVYIFAAVLVIPTFRSTIRTDSFLFQIIITWNVKLMLKFDWLLWAIWHTRGCFCHSKLIPNTSYYFI